MPYTVSDVDKHKKGLTPSQKSKWVSIANSVLQSCKKDGGSDCEGKAIRIANSKFAIYDIDSIWTISDVEDHDVHFGINEDERKEIEEDLKFQSKTEDRKKPGGSNAGKYKKGPFCGPAGGAPKGTYPVNTRARAIAAIGYARHAPNPAGIKACVCRHYSDLPACKSKKKQSEEITMKVPKGAFRLMDVGNDCHAFAEGSAEAKRLQMKVYSGGVIKNHWYWGNLAIDISGMSFPKNKYPVLEDHMTSKKIAFSKKPVIDKEGGLSLDPETTTFVSTPFSEEFQRLSAEGFPYQASLYARPSVIETVEEGATVDVNGYKFKGPGRIWRKSEYKEGSICVFGHDSNTQSSAFSDKEEEEITVEEITLMEPAYESETDNKLTLNEKEVSKVMTEDELRTQYPELIKSITDSAIATFKAEAEKNQATQTAQMAALKDENVKLSEKVVSLEKKDAIRTEKELQMQADRIWDGCLSKSDVAERLYDKVRGMVNYSKFVENDVLDVEKFTAAVNAEIEDWVSRGATGTVLGGGYQSKDDASQQGTRMAQEKKENDDTVDSLLKLSGQKIEEKKT